MIPQRIKLAISGVGALVAGALTTVAAHAVEFTTFSATEAKDIVAGAFNTGIGFYLLVIGVLMGTGILLTAAWWAYQKVKGLLFGRTKKRA